MIEKLFFTSTKHVIQGRGIRAYPEKCYTLFGKEERTGIKAGGKR